MKQLKTILYVLITVATLTAVYGIYQYAFGDIYSQAWLDGEMFEDIKMRVYSTLENPNVYGEYLLLIIPIIAALFWTEKGFKTPTEILYHDEIQRRERMEEHKKIFRSSEGNPVDPNFYYNWMDEE